MRTTPIRVNRDRLLELAEYFNERVEDIPLTAIRSVIETPTSYAMLVENDMGGEAPPALFGFFWLLIDGAWKFVSAEQSVLGCDREFANVEEFRKFALNVK